MPHLIGLLLRGDDNVRLAVDSRRRLGWIAVIVMVSVIVED
jgi:hypothetical protein